MATKKPRPVFKRIAALPTGQWEFCLVTLEGQADVIVVIDRTGLEAPRMIIDGKLREGI